MGGAAEAAAMRGAIRKHLLKQWEQRDGHHISIGTFNLASYGNSDLAVIASGP